MEQKISLFTLSLSKGGAESQLVKLAVYLKTKDIDIRIFYLLPRNDFVKLLKEKNISYEYIPIKYGRGIFDLFKKVKTHRTDVLISFMFGANIIARMIKWFTPIKLITSVRNNEIARRYYWLYKLTYKLDDISTFNSIVSLNKFKEERLTVSEKSFLLNNAISISEFSNSLKGNKEFTFISIAHFRPQKDYRTLFEAVAILSKQGVLIRLQVLGQIGNQKWPFELIKELKIEDSVEILGFVNDPTQYIENADAVVLSTFWEGTPNAVLEGMSKKKPIVCTAVPGCVELINEAKCGFLSKKESPNDLAEKMKNLIELTDGERTSLSNNGFQYVLENYEESKVLKKWVELISAL